MIDNRKGSLGAFLVVVGLILVIEWLRKVARGVEDAAPYTWNFIRQ